MDLSLAGKRALVGGSSQGIGQAAAVALAELGAEIVLIARNEIALKEVKSLLSVGHGQFHSYIIADFAQPAQVQKAIKDFIDAGHSIDILVNNTGGPPGGPAASAKIEDFNNAFSQHLICNHILAQAVLPGMKVNGFGRIINVISTSVKQPLPNLGVSNTVRAAVANWAKTLANELGRYGITVNNVLPGATGTGRLQSIISGKSDKTGQSVDHVEKDMLRDIPAGRFGRPEEIANAIAFLASPAAAY
nr:SDR family oxidoreductase [Bacteroidota bacterium]